MFLHFFFHLESIVKVSSKNDEWITSRTSSSADFFGFDEIGNGFLKTAVLLVVGSILDFFAVISSGISLVVVVRFWLVVAKIDGLKRKQNYANKTSQDNRNAHGRIFFLSAMTVWLNVTWTKTRND